MSIINNVLKDLEARPSRFTPIEIAAAEPGRVERYTMRVMLLVLLPILVVLTALIFYYQTIYESDRKQAIADTSVLNKNVLPVLESTPVVEPVQNQISGLQIRETRTEVSLEFALRERAVSYLKERSDNLFIFHLKGVQSEIEAPKITNNRWIENLQIQPGQQGVDVVLKTVPGVLVNTAQANDREENLWTIRLERLPDPSTLARLEAVVVEPVVKPEEVNATAIRSKTVEAEMTRKEPVKVEIKAVDQSPSASVKLTKATELIRDRRWQEAEPLLNSLVDSPLDFSARRQLLVLYKRSGNSSRYLEVARQAQRRYPQQSIFKTELARALFHHQQYSEAIKLLQNSGDLDVTQHALLAAGYQRIDRHQEAIEHYHHALKLDQGQARNWIGLGISLEHEAKLEKALESYKTALRLGNLSERLTEFVEQRSRVITKVIN